MAQLTATPVPIKTFTYPTLGRSVSGRELYNLVTANHSETHWRQFSEWFKSYAGKLGLVEGKDFIRTKTLLPERGPRQQVEYYPTVEAAVKIARIQQAKRGLGVVAFLETPTPEPQPGGCSTIAPAADTKQSGVDTSDGRLRSHYRLPQLTSAEQQDAQALELPLKATNGAEATETTPEAVTAPSVPILTPAQKLLQQAQKLVDEEEARARIEKERPALPVEELAAVNARLDTVEKRLNVVLYFFQQASHALRTLQPVGLPSAAEELITIPPMEPTTRGRINRLVNAYAAATEKPEKAVWKMLYGHLVTRHIFDPWEYTNGQRDAVFIDIVEEHGQLENLYTVAKEVLTIK